MDTGFLGGSGMFLLLTASIFSLLIPKTTGLASWAKQNKKQARWLIAGGHLITGFGAYFMGRQLAHFGINTTEASTFSLLSFAILAALILPEKESKTWVKYSYRNNKLLWFLVLLTGFFLFLNIGNREATDKYFNPVPKIISEAAGSNLYADWQENLTQIQDEHSPENLNDGIAILLVVLTSIIFAAIFMGVAAISCYLFCSNQGVAAAFVLIGGVGLGVYLLIITLKEINKGLKQRQAERPRKKPKAPYKLKWF